MSTFEATLHQLPRPILEKLRSVIARVRRLLFVRGICATAAVALLCLLAIMAIDASVTIFSTKVRWALSLTGLAVTLATAWWFLLRPLSRKVSLTQVARILEIRHPELQERISTAVELMSSEDPEEIKGSEELIQAVVDSAVLDVENVDPKREFKGSRAARFVKLAVACLAVLALVLAVFPHQGFSLLARAVAPFLNIGNAYANTMVVQPGDIRVAKGDEVSITMTVRHHRLKRAELRRTLEDGSESVERMQLMGKTEEGAQKFSITFPSVNDSFQYRVRAGAGLSEYYKVDAVPAPEIVERTVRYDFPEYTGLTPVEKEAAEGEIRALAHTKVTVTSKSNKEIWSARALLNDSQELGATEVTSQTAITTFNLHPRFNGTWRLDLEDMDKFTAEPEPFPIQALPDKSPVVRITNPVVRELRLRPVEVLPIHYEINEDFGFSEIALLVTPNGEPNPRVIVQPEPASGGEGGPGVWRGMTSLNLASLDLQRHHRRLQVQLRALDNRPESLNGPGEGVSETIVILIDHNAASLADQTIDSQRRELTEAIRKAKNDLERAKNEMRDAERELARKNEVSENAERDVRDFQEQTENAEETLNEVAEKLSESVFKPQAEALEKVTGEEINQAQEAADMIQVSDEKRDRIAKAQEARKEVEQALAELREVENSIREADKDLDAIAQLNDLANDQRQLAKDASERAARQQENPELNRQEQQAMNDFQRRQERVQDQLGDLLKDNAAALQEILQEQQKTAEELAAQAEQLADAQEEVRKLTQNESARGNSPERQQAVQEQLMKHLQKMQEQIADETRQVQQDLAQANSPPEPQAANQNSQPEQGQDANNPEKGEAQNQNENQSQMAEGQKGEPQEGASDPETAQAESESSQEPENASGQPDESNEAMSPSQESPSQEPSSLAQAAEQTQNAAESLAEQNVPNAAEAARQASEALAQAAQEVASDSETGDSPQQQGESPSGEQRAGETQQASQVEQGNEAQGEPGEMSQAENQPTGQGEPGQENAAAQSSEPSDSPDSSAMEEAAESLGQLAERQEQLAEQIAAIEVGDIQEALEMMEQQLAEQSAQVQDAASGLEQTLENLGQRQSRNEAGQASNFLANAEQKAQQAQQDLAQAQKAQAQAEQSGQVQPGEMSRQAQQALVNSQSDQHQAQMAMERASQNLSRSSRSIGQTLKGLRPSEEDQRLAQSEQMAESFNEVTEAAQAQNAQQAASKSQQAAQSLQELAQQAMQQIGQMGETPPPTDQQNLPTQEMNQMAQGGVQPNEGSRAADANGDGVPPELRDLGITAGDWARFKGALTGGSATAIDTNLPAEYRELVGRYFQVIAKEAGK